MDNVMNFIYLVYYILLVVACWKVFEKAGEKGWKSLIPFYNLYILTKISWGSGWWFLLLLVPVVNIFIEIFTSIKLGKAFNKSTAFAIGLVLFFPIFLIILGFNNDEYVGPPRKGEQ